MTLRLVRSAPELGQTQSGSAWSSATTRPLTRVRWAGSLRYCGRVLDRVGFADMLTDVIDLSDAIYAANRGQPTELSTAAQEVEQFDLELEAATGPPAPLFGAYADAEGKARALNDLVCSAATLLARDDTNVGYVNALRAAMETAARLYWVLAPDGGHLDRAGRFIRERLRSISEVSKFNAETRTVMSMIKAELIAGADRAGITVPSAPAALDLIADLVTRPGVLNLRGIDREEAGAMFYRLPSAPTHAAVHGIALHHADPNQDSTGRRTTPEPWEHTLVVGAGLYAGYTTTHRALLLLYGWDATDWDRHVRAAAQRIAGALAAERQ